MEHKQLYRPNLWAQSRRLTSHWPSIFLLLAVAVWSALPYLAHGYNFPPNDDSWALEADLATFPSILRYYGHLPALFTGITFYYYVTPLIVAFSYVLALRRYGRYMPILAWVAVFGLSRTALFDLGSGNMVSTLGFHAVGIAVLALYQRQGFTSWGAALGGVFFHVGAGVTVGVGMLGVAVMERRWRVVLPALILGGLVVSFMRWGHIGKGRFAMETTQPMGFVDFFTIYMGLPLILFTGFALLVVKQAYRAGWRPRRDMLILSLTALVIILPVFIFTPLQINSDRHARFLVAAISLLSMVVTARSLVYLQRPRLTALGVGVILFLGSWGLYDNTVYWLTLGAFR